MPKFENIHGAKALKFSAILAAFIMLAGCKGSGKAPDDMVHVAAGEFTMGSSMIDKDAKALQYGFRKPLYANEHPSHKVTLASFYIDKLEVSNKKYQEFLKSTRHRLPKGWKAGKYPQGLGDHPVVNVSWEDADFYCRWKKKRLPTEAEWEKAARGTDARRFAWGSEFDIKLVNAMGKYEGTTPVGKFPEGASPYGALDMSGNVMEWTSDWYKRYPGSEFDDEEYGEKFKAVRSGGWGGTGHYALQAFVSTTYRMMFEPAEYFDDLGIRCAKSD